MRTVQFSIPVGAGEIYPHGVASDRDRAGDWRVVFHDQRWAWPRCDVADLKSARSIPIKGHGLTFHVGPTYYALA